MITDDERLYYTCMHFCEAFFELLCAKDEIYMRKLFDAYESHQRKEYAERRLRHNFDDLCELIDKIREDGKNGSF